MIHPTAKVCKEVNRKLPARNITLYTDPVRHNAQCYRRANGRTTSWCQEPIIRHAAWHSDWVNS